MIAVLGALIAGALTTLAPCAISLLPVIVGGSVQTVPGRERAGPNRAVLVAGALGVSVVVFTLLLKASTVLIGVPPSTWRWVSGVVLVALGVVALFPGTWDRFSIASGLSHRSATACPPRHGARGVWAPFSPAPPSDPCSPRAAPSTATSS